MVDKKTLIKLLSISIVAVAIIFNSIIVPQTVFAVLSFGIVSLFAMHGAGAI